MNGRFARYRRSFVALAGAITIASALAVPAAAQAPGSQLARRIIDLTRDWRFALANPQAIAVPAGFSDAHLPAYDDSRWRTLDVPHDWSIELAPVAGPGTSGDTGFLPGGLGFYRKWFALPLGLAGKKISIEFDGVYMNSEVYINGHLVGTHPYGYTGFAFDISNLVAAGSAANLVVVKVQNQLPSSRWYSGSGIYRSVRLVATDPVHVARLGSFVTTPDVASTIGAGHADVRVVTDIVNELAGDASVAVTYTVRDGRGRAVGRAGSSLTVSPGTARNTAVVRVANPALWSINTPTTYTLETRLSVGPNDVDAVETRFGMRWVEIDPERGMLINGEPTKIRGVDLHHDLGALGAAVHRDAVLRQMSIMKAMGVNALRTAHNPPSPELIDVCERLGIVVMVEAFDTWRNNKTEFDYGDWFELEAPGAGGLLWSDLDIMEMVNTFKSSPAVIMWSIGNEIRGQTVEDAARLVADIKSIDTSRPVVWGSDSYRSPPSPTSVNGRIALLLDGVGLNYNTARSVDALHALYPGRFFFESESSSSTSARGIYQWPDQLNTGEDYTPGQRLVSSYDNNMASWTMPGEYGLKKDRDRRFFTGEFLWSGFDYIGEPTPYAQFPVKSSSFGAVDTAGFPKDLFYAFASQWTTAPMVHLVPMNWTDHRPGEEVTVWAYANVDTVELFLNGVSLGIRRYDHKTTTFGTSYLETTEPTGDDKTFASGSYTSPNGSTGKLHLTWSVAFQPGELTAVATRNGVEVARDILRTAGRPHALRLTPERFAIPADGRSLSFVVVEVVDRNGVVVPSAHQVIHFEVSGGALAGVDNGRQESAESYQAPQRSAFNGKALAIVRSDGRAGPIAITATADGLLPAATTVFETRIVGPRTTDREREEPGLPFDRVGVVEPVLRTPVGVVPGLPRTVAVVLGDGTTSQQAVRWSPIAPEQLASERPYTVDGELEHRLPQPGDRVTAHVTPFTVTGVQAFATAVPVRVAPFLPSQARVTYSDGVSEDIDVTWDPVPTDELDRVGEFSLQGRLVGTQLATSVLVTVSDAFTPDQNLAPNGVPSASFSGAPSTVPAALIDGLTVDANGWSNRYQKQSTALLPAFSLARPSDWVSLSWTTPQAIDRLVPYFRLAAGRTLPAAVSVEYWDGRAFVPAAHPSVTWATASDEPTTIAFDKVSTTQVRLVMTSAAPGTSNGFVQISELQTLGDRPSAAALPRRAALGGDDRAAGTPGGTASGSCAAAGDPSLLVLAGSLAGLGLLVGRPVRRAWRRRCPKSGR
jgi:beta-galactosidase